MKFKLDFERCKGCSLCVDTCPKGIVKMQNERLNKCGYYTVECTDDSACTSCTLCAVMCPDCAITIND
jgi:2-oxoglutarate ferredoxin oxidoreductase subunit delta